jgi:hypothetical protein
VGQALLAQGVPEGLQAAHQTTALFELLQGGVGLLFDQRCEPVVVVRAEGGGRAPAVRLGLDRAGIAAALEQSDDEGEADAEPPGDLAQGAFLVVHGVDDALTKVARVGAHGDLLRNGFSLRHSSRMQPAGKPL